MVGLPRVFKWGESALRVPRSGNLPAAQSAVLGYGWLIGTVLGFEKHRPNQKMQPFPALYVIP